jgi:hypothetical protein
MSKIKEYSWLIIFPLALIVIIGWWLYQIHQLDSEGPDFVASLASLSNDSNTIETYKQFSSAEDVGDGWYTINSLPADPSQNRYYSETGSSIDFAAFASSTNLTEDQINFVISVLQKYPYIDEFYKDFDITGTEKIYPPAAIIFYLKESQFSNTYQRHGYMYVPFAFTQDDQANIDEDFTSMVEIGTNWYIFSGQHT